MKVMGSPEYQELCLHDALCSRAGAQKLCSRAPERSFNGQRDTWTLGRLDALSAEKNEPQAEA